MVEGRLDVGGAVAFWTLAEWTDRDRLRAGLTPLGLEKFVPEPRPAPAVLRDALEEVVGGPRVLVRPLAGRDGFAVVRGDRGAARNAYALAHPLPQVYPAGGGDSARRRDSRPSQPGSCQGRAERRRSVVRRCPTRCPDRFSLARRQPTRR